MSDHPELESVACEVLDTSGSAFLLRDKSDPGRVSWFPKSQVSFSRRNMRTGDAVAEIPLWLLEKKNWNS